MSQYEPRYGIADIYINTETEYGIVNHSLGFRALEVITETYPVEFNTDIDELQDVFGFDSDTLVYNNHNSTYMEVQMIDIANEGGDFTICGVVNSEGKPHVYQNYPVPFGYQVGKKYIDFYIHLPDWGSPYSNNENYTDDTFYIQTLRLANGYNTADVDIQIRLYDDGNATYVISSSGMSYDLELPASGGDYIITFVLNPDENGYRILVQDSDYENIYYQSEYGGNYSYLDDGFYCPLVIMHGSNSLANYIGFDYSDSYMSTEVLTGNYRENNFELETDYGFRYGLHGYLAGKYPKNAYPNETFYVTETLRFHGLLYQGQDSDGNYDAVIFKGYDSEAIPIRREPPFFEYLVMMQVGTTIDESGSPLIGDYPDIISFYKDAALWRGRALQLEIYGTQPDVSTWNFNLSGFDGVLVRMSDVFIPSAFSMIAPPLSETDIYYDESSWFQAGQNMLSGNLLVDGNVHLENFYIMASINTGYDPDDIPETNYDNIIYLTNCKITERMD